MRLNLRLAIRNAKKNIATTAIHVLGLAVGISASIVIFITIRYDYSFDKWEPQGQNIYRVYTSFADGGGNYGISMLAPQTIDEQVTGIDALAHILVDPFYNATIRTDLPANNRPGVFMNVQGIVAADPYYFKIFPRQWLAGSAAGLRQINSVVLTESMAQKMFGNTSPQDLIGRSLVIQDTINTVIKGVVANINANTDFNYPLFISLATITQTPLIHQVTNTPHWTNVDGSSQCFVKLLPDVDPANVNLQIKKLYIDHQKDATAKSLQTGKLQPLKDIHFNMDLGGTVSKASLRNLGMLAILLLLLAAINFINLSTAQSTLRAREVGVRKTFGGRGLHIFKQFLCEILVITCLAAMLALLLVPLLLHIFADFMPSGLLSANPLLDPVILLFLILLIPVITLLAGAYPAFILTRFKPALVLKNKLSNNGKTSAIREGLIVFQFVLAQAFLIVVFVTCKQIHYELNKDIGVKKAGIVSIFIPDFTKLHASKSQVLLSELRQLPQIAQLTLCTKAPVSDGWSSTAIQWFNKGDQRVFDNVHVRSADENYLQVFGLQLAAGKNIHIDSSAAVTDVLINESLCRQMGFHEPADAIGEIISGGPSDSARIVGVLKDFTTLSVHHPIYPTTIFAGNNGFSPTLAIALAGHSVGQWQAALAKIETTFRSIYPYKEFNAKFLDETIRHLYQSDIRLSKLLKWATGLALLISCLGLVGLVSFMTAQRTKEIAVRKVLGASSHQIIRMLSKGLIRLILIASMIALPIGWYFAHRWLSDFAFKTALNWWIFGLCIAGTLLLALTILCLRSYKTATANPVNSLKET